MAAGATTVLGFAMRKHLFFAQDLSRQIAETQLRLSTGRKVNSALDNPQNFFTAQTLDYRQQDLLRLQDDMSQNIQAIKEATLGVKALEKQLDVIDSFLNETRLDLISETDGDLKATILEDKPDAYYRLDDMSTGTAENLGAGGAAINGTYLNNPQNAEESIYINGAVAGEFNGTNQSVSIPDSPLINTSPTPARTIEVVFEADNPDSRQVIYEEGGTLNAIAIYVENGKLYFNARDAGDWGPVDMSVDIEAGETYHAALVFDGSDRDFRAYLDGELVGVIGNLPRNTFPSHGNNIGIGRMNQNSYFHDGPANGSGFYFDGRISDVAIYNTVLEPDTIKEHFKASNLDFSKSKEAEFNALVEQYNRIAKDTQYRGNNLLMGETLRTDFNEDRTAFLETHGQNMLSTAMDLTDIRIRTVNDIDDMRDKIRLAKLKLRTFSESLANDLTIIQTREDFTQNLINTLAEGADKLTLADQNTESAKMLALQVRQSMQTVAMGLVASSNASILTLVANTDI